MCSNKKHYAKGFCRSCYDKQPERKRLRNIKTSLWNKTEQAKISFRKYYRNNTEKSLLASKNWRIKHPSYSAKYHQSRFLVDPSYKLAFNLRRRIRYVLKKNKKVKKTFELVGCTIEQFWNHLEKQFQPGMTRQNHGKNTWHIDHIRPLASFDLTDPAQQKIAFHYTNMQPLWAKDNLRKSKKYVQYTRTK